MRDASFQANLCSGKAPLLGCPQLEPLFGLKSAESSSAMQTKGLAHGADGFPVCNVLRAMSWLCNFSICLIQRAASPNQTVSNSNKMHSVVLGSWLGESFLPFA